MRKVRKAKITSFNKAILKRKYISIFLALFTFGVNIFAWFAFSSHANVSLDATISSWDVEFSSNGEATQNLVIDVTKMKPGMNNFTKTIDVSNHSDVSADFTYEITSFKLLGHTFNNMTSSQLITYLGSNYPFNVSFNASKMILTTNDTLTFDINVAWPFESASTTYYKLDSAYQYDSSFVYYKLVNNSYNPFSVPNSSVFNSNLNELYLEKDDADTFFGMNCDTYESNSGEACLVLNLKLMVLQRNA